MNARVRTHISTLKVCWGFHKLLRKLPAATAGVKLAVTANGDQPSHKLCTHIRVQVLRIHIHQLGAGSTADKWEIFCTYTPKQTQTNIHSSVTADQQGWRRC
jgi:hypothetical protein